MHNFCTKSSSHTDNALFLTLKFSLDIIYTNIVQRKWFSLYIRFLAGSLQNTIIFAYMTHLYDTYGANLKGELET